MNEMTHTINGPRTADDDYQVELARAMRRALKCAVDYAMRHDDATVAANEALAMLRAEFLWRFELLRSRQRQPALIVPQPLPTTTVRECAD